MKTSTQIKEKLAPPSRFYARKRNLFSVEYLNKLRSAILASPYLAPSHFSNNFTKTKGFSVVFKRSGINKVIQKFPEFQPYLETALKSGCNAFYLNPLVLEMGGDVKPHVDCSISAYEMVLTIPRLVSVLYVQVAKDIQGGELVLDSGDSILTKIRPENNVLLYFLGNLIHSVKPFKGSQPCISLICEQYNLASSRLENIPDFEIISENTPQPKIKNNTAKLSFSIDNFLTPQQNNSLLDLAISDKSNFISSELEVNSDRAKPGSGADRNYSNSQHRHSLVYEPDFPKFSDLISNRIRKVLPDVLKRLNITAFPIAGIETQLTAHNDGHYFRLHSDSSVELAVGRQITFVYYFNQPRAFSGGELRIFDTDSIENLSYFELIKPKNNSIIFFPSYYLHEVLPINCPSKIFANSRFTVNGWIWQKV